MLILAGVAINIIINGGLFDQANKAALETRGASVEEEAGLWKAEVVMVNRVGGTAMTPEEKIADLVKRKLLTTGEQEQLLTGGEYNGKSITIGSREIDFNVVTDSEFDNVNGVNKPKLLDGMIPIYYDNGDWKVAEEGNSGNQWYNYTQNDRQYANICTVADTNSHYRTDEVRNNYTNRRYDNNVCMDTKI